MFNLFTHGNNDSHKPIIPTALVSPDRTRRQALRAKLAGYPPIRVIASVCNGPAALTQIQQRQPGLLIIDACLPAIEAEWLLARVRAGAPQVRCLVCGWSDPCDGLSPATQAAVDAFIRYDSPGQQWQETLLGLTQPVA